MGRVGGFSGAVLRPFGGGVSLDALYNTNSSGGGVTNTPGPPAAQPPPATGIPSVNSPPVRDLPNVAGVHQASDAGPLSQVFGSGLAQALGQVLSGIAPVLSGVLSPLSTLARPTIPADAPKAPTGQLPSLPSVSRPSSLRDFLAGLSKLGSTPRIL